MSQAKGIMSTRNGKINNVNSTVTNHNTFYLQCLHLQTVENTSMNTETSFKTYT